LEKEIQKTYLKSVEDSYRYLADILIAQGRIAEAEEVLGMLKEEEYFSYLRRDQQVADNLNVKISFSPDEQQEFTDYEKKSDEITQAAQEFEELKKKIPVGKDQTALSADEQLRYKELENRYNAAVTAFLKFLDDLRIKFSQSADKSKIIAQAESITQNLLRNVNEPRTVIISTIVGEDRLNLIVTTRDIQTAHTVEIKGEEINKLVVKYRADLQNPTIDPRPVGEQLYKILFPEKLRQELNALNADKIVWSLDGTLRYIPMATLWDGEKYLAERYSQAVITLASLNKLDTAPTSRQSWKAFGVGVSKKFEKFSELPAVPRELCSVVKDPAQQDFCQKLGATGVFDGVMLRDEDFTLDRFKPSFGKLPLVHVASHFDLKAGDYKESYLLLGGGENRRFSLEELRTTRLDGVEMLTLSACNTAMSPGNQTNGLEVEGFGTLAQKQGVKTVLATLWAVADESTGVLMTEFYRILETNPNLSKAEALRQAQLKLMYGKYKTGENIRRRDGVEVILDGDTRREFIRDANAPYAHPYFWSPFVLIGNWR
jgi:CHAT domain-containing protein